MGVVTNVSLTTMAYASAALDSWVTTVLVLMALVAVLAMHFWSVRHFMGWLRRHAPKRAASIADFMQLPCSTYIPILPSWVATIVKNIPAIFDSASDGNQVGGARSRISDVENKHFVENWVLWLDEHKVLWLSDVVAELGIGGVLTALVIMFTAIQVVLTVSQLQKCFISICPDVFQKDPVWESHRGLMFFHSSCGFSRLTTPCGGRFALTRTRAN